MIERVPLITRPQAGTPLGLVNINTTSVATVSADAEDTLQSYTLPANTLDSNGRGLRIRVGGITANNANVKTIKLYFGATIIWQGAVPANSVQAWFAEGLVLRTAAGAQIASSHGQSGPDTGGTESMSAFWLHATPAADETGTILIKTTGRSVTIGDATQLFTMIEVF